MPLPIAHGLVGASVIAASRPQISLRRDWKVLLLGAVLAITPDFDLFFMYGLDLGRGWHRSFTHSIVFALAATCLMLAVKGASRIREVVAYGSALLSHGLLDFLATEKYDGVQLLWPFSTRMFKLGLFGFSEFGTPDYPWTAVVLGFLKPCLVELAIFAPVFLAVYLLRRGALKSSPPREE
jgi:membrane-bound metal-dependent hydrolase YbcI (DUF457 family)